MTSPTILQSPSTPTARPTAVPSGLANIPKIEATHNKKSLLAKGEPGTGKTHLALQFPPPLFVVYTDPNRDTVKSALRANVEMDARRVLTWPQWEGSILPAINNRQIVAETIVLDTWDFLFQSLVRSIKGSGSMQMQDWGTVLDKASNSCLSLVSATAAIATHPGYNVVVTCHTRKETDEKGNVVAVTPHIQGQFKDSLEAYFDAVLICTKGERTVVGEKGQPAQRKRMFYLHSLPPSPHETCKSPAHWPGTIPIEAGENAYEKLSQVWDNPPQAGTK